MIIEEKEKIKDNLSLEELIKKVDYNKFNSSYIPSQFAIKFINFIKLVNGENGEENTSPLFHYDILDSITKNGYNLFVAFRGSAKSTIMEYLVLYIATFGHLDGFGKVELGLYVADTMENGAKNFRSNIEFRWDNSTFLKKFIPKTRFTDNRLIFTNAEGHKLIWKLYGATTGVRGVKEMGMRPKIAIFDDLMSDKNADSPAVTAMIEKEIYNSVLPALHPTKKKIIWIGTPFNKKDPLYKAAGSKSWNTKVFPICQKFPCTEDEFIGAWEDRFTLNAVKEIYGLLKSNGKTDAFNQEYMLRILSDEDRLVLDEDIIWYESRSSIINNLKDYNVYITTDFATSEKESADFSVIAVWALDNRGIFHWIDGVVKRQDMAVNVDDIFRLASLYNPLLTGVELSGQQKGFVSWIKRDMLTRGQWFTLASDKSSGEEGLRPTTNKLVRFNVALPLFKQRKIAFPKELENSAIILEYIDELTSVTPSGIKSLHDDCIDSVSQLQMIEYFLPHDPKINNVSNEKVQFDDSKYYREPVVEQNVNSYIV